MVAKIAYKKTVAKQAKMEEYVCFAAVLFHI